AVICSHHEVSLLSRVCFELQLQMAKPTSELTHKNEGSSAARRWRVAWPAFRADLSLLDHIHELPDAGDLDSQHVPHCQREVIRRHDAGARQQDHAMGETVVTAQPLNEVVEFARHLRDAGGAGEHLAAPAFDREVDLNPVERRHGVYQCNYRSQSTAVVIDLGL